MQDTDFSLFEFALSLSATLDTTSGAILDVALFVELLLL